MPGRIIWVQTHEPTEQQVVIELLNQHALGVNAVNRLQQQEQQLLLWRDRGHTAPWIQLLEGWIEPFKSQIRQSPHLLQRLGCGYAVFRGEVREQGTGAFLQAAHPISEVAPFSLNWLAFQRTP
jgi:hypothetical protein